MGFADVKEWMDALVDNLEYRRSMDSFNNQVQTISTNNRIHMDSGIDILADMLGVDLKEKVLEDVEYPYRYHFFYRNIEVFQLSKEKVIDNARTD